MPPLRLIAPTSGVFDTPLVCIQINQDWIDALATATERLEFSNTWEDGADLRFLRGEVLKLVDYLVDAKNCQVNNAPYWDDADGDDADGEDSNLDTGFPWYEDVADWIVTAFLAAAFTPQAAISFTTSIRKIRLAFRTRAWGALFNVFVDDLLVASGDTYSETPDLLEMDLDLEELAPVGFRAQASPARTIKIVHAGSANPNAIPLSGKGFGLEVVRKNLRQPELDIVYGDEPPTFQRIYDDFQRVYGVPMTIPFDIRINGCELEKTTDNGETWVSVGDLSECATGEAGPAGASVELRTTATHIQWRQDDDSPTWADLVALDDLKGSDGADGQDGEDGLTFTSVSTTTLAPGSNATGTVVSGVLQLGIPQGLQGIQGVQGVQGATGATGAQGAKGDPGDCAEDCVNGEPVAITETEDNNLCAGAIGLTDYVLSVLNYSLNEIDNSGGTIVNSGNLLALFSDSLEKLFKAIPYAEDIVDFLTIARDIGTGIIRDQINNPDYREEVFCSLYCKAKAAGGFDETVFTAWLNDLPPVAGSAHYDDMARRILGWTKCSQRFFIYAQGASAECELCVDCAEEPEPECFVVLGGYGLRGATYLGTGTSTGATYDPVNDWITVQTSAYGTGNSIMIEMTNIPPGWTRCLIEYDRAVTRIAASANPTNTGIGTRSSPSATWNGGTWTSTNFPMGGTVSAPVSGVQTRYTTSGGSYYCIRIAAGNLAANSALVRLKRIEFCYEEEYE